MDRKRFAGIAAIVLVIIILDQLSKILILQNIEPGQEISVIPGLFNMTLTFNPGVAFGMFAGLTEGLRQGVLTVTTVVALGVVVYLLIYDYRGDRLAQGALSMVLGGALGNLVDRFRIGHVVDFLDFYYGSYHWPAFNVADSSIFCGVALLVLHGIFGEKQANK